MCSMVQYEYKQVLNKSIITGYTGQWHIITQDIIGNARLELDTEQSCVCIRSQAANTLLDGKNPPIPA
jgi:hypothetical protein